MKSPIIQGIIITLIAGAIAASAKSIVDVAVLKTDVINLYKLVVETRNDVKDIKTYLLEKK